MLAKHDDNAASGSNIMGPYLSAPITTKDSTEGSAGRISFGATHMQGWRNTMEDAHTTQVSLPGGAACFGVFDGHGGKEIAVFAERHFVQELTSNPRYLSGAMEQALRETYLGIDSLLMTGKGAEEVFRIQHDLPPSAVVDAKAAKESVGSAGCTAVVALIYGQRLYVANAGDSRCVLARSGRAVDMSVDHKPDLPQELARIRAAGSTVIDGRVNGNINLSRSLGDLEYKSVPNLPPERQAVTACPDVREMELTRDDDFLVLACDGIWDILTSQACVDFIYERMGTKSLKSICEDVCDRCLARSTTEMEGRGCDNMTVVIVTWSKE